VGGDLEITTKRPPGWVQINFPAPDWWKEPARALQQKALEAGERISLEEAVRRLYRRGAESEGVWPEQHRLQG
jgi:hypothetical protein